MRPTCCFVLMPFKPALDNVYREVRRAVEEYAGFECVRADEIARSNRITDDIYEQIQTARFLIADLTGGNPNVYYELGLSHALDKEVILLVQGSGVPFDVGGIRYLKYTTSDLEALYWKLTRYIKRSLDTVPDQWRTDLTEKGPDIRISGLEWPRRPVPTDQPIRIRVQARNFGQTAAQGYFSLSFPFGVTNVKIVESDLPDTRVGERGQRWKSDQVILDYPIAEAAVRHRPEWLTKVSHTLTVEVVPNRRGIIQFYVSSSAFSAAGQHVLDPSDTPLLDQREEPVYCGVIEAE